MDNILTDYIQDFVLWLRVFIPNLIKATLMSAVGWVVARWAKNFIEGAAAKFNGDLILWSYLSTVVRYIIMIIVFTAALNTAGFPVGSLLATFGISGVIIGLGARQSISNYFFGIMMLSARPFKQGDLIEFGPPPQVGIVHEVKMTYTALDTLDNVRLIVPNSVIWRNKIINFSVHTARAIRIPLSLPYDVDVDWVRDISLDVLKRHQAVLNEPAPTFTVSDVTATDVKALLVAWSGVDTMNVFGDVITQMRKELETAGLAVTVPAKDIDLKREE
ncbi:MAG: mechanosensitive ion channel family protein [bacterium]|nr:mechanosensitive ion channel family protein [bacterium]